MNKAETDDYSIDVSLDDKGDGEFIVFDKEKQKIREKTPYKHNKKNGISVTYFYDKEKNGRIETPFVDDKIQGVVLHYINDMLFREESFVDNKRNGITKDYKIINKKQVLWIETSYKNGLKNGLSIEYDDDGKTIKKKTIWLNGKETNKD